jgi:hypothetical protein
MSNDDNTSHPVFYHRFIQAFQSYYVKQREYFEQEKLKMKTGVEKLFEAAEQVQKITHELVAKEQDMAIANVDAAKVDTLVFFHGDVIYSSIDVLLSLASS